MKAIKAKSKYLNVFLQIRKIETTPLEKCTNAKKYDVQKTYSCIVTITNTITWFVIN